MPLAPCEGYSAMGRIPCEHTGASSTPGRHPASGSPAYPTQEAVREQKSMAKQKGKMEKLSELEEEVRKQAQSLLQRANGMCLEQEDEIKEFSGYDWGLPNVTGITGPSAGLAGPPGAPVLTLNPTSLIFLLARSCPCRHCWVRPGEQSDLLSPQLILRAKCHMIRNTQILSKSYGRRRSTWMR